jgi:glycosyltransferase involved in cell wall biosynthesis
MKTYIVGIRGFPNVQGGAEKHSEELYRRLAHSAQCDITVFTRRPYIHEVTPLTEWKGVKFIHLWSPQNASIETIVHTFLSVVQCIVKRPGIVHVHNIGPGLFIPLLKLAGLKVVMTYHSMNYEHQKWGTFAKTLLRWGEYLSLHFADRVIVVSEATKQFLERKYHRRDLVLIPNGVNLPTLIPPGRLLYRYGLEPKKYVFTAARFSVEKGLHDLIQAYRKIRNPSFKLVIAGDADQETSYSRKLKRLARQVPGVILTGYVSGRALGELFSNAGLFALPSYHEGLPIALLEALSYGLPVLVSDIPQNRDLPIPEYRYFPAGNVDILARKLIERIKGGITEREQGEQREYIKKKYNWDAIAEQTLQVYRSIENNGKGFEETTLTPNYVPPENYF